MGAAEDITPLAAIVCVVFWLPVTVASYILTARRMHDVGKSAWFMLVPIYPIVLLCREEQAEDNKYRPKASRDKYEPTHLKPSKRVIISMGAAAAVIVVLFLAAGTSDRHYYSSNDYDYSSYSESSSPNCSGNNIDRCLDDIEDIIDDMEVAMREQDVAKLIQLNAKLDTLKDKYGIGTDIDMDDLTADQVARFMSWCLVCQKLRKSITSRREQGTR